VPAADTLADINDVFRENGKKAHTMKDKMTCSIGSKIWRIQGKIQ
jgi:hypothetical protein